MCYDHRDMFYDYGRGSKVRGTGDAERFEGAPASPKVVSGGFFGTTRLFLGPPPPFYTTTSPSESSLESKTRWGPTSGGRRGPRTEEKRKGVSHRSHHRKQSPDGDRRGGDMGHRAKKDQIEEAMDGTPIVQRAVKNQVGLSMPNQAQ